MILLARLIIGGIIAAAAAAVIVICISGTISPAKVKEEMKKRGIKKGIVDIIEKCNNEVTFMDFYSNQQYKFQGDGIDDSIYEKMEIKI